LKKSYRTKKIMSRRDADNFSKPLGLHKILYKWAFVALRVNARAHRPNGFNWLSLVSGISYVGNLHGLGRDSDGIKSARMNG
jgi:hypothetical protein